MKSTPILKNAQQHCDETGARFTEPRRAVLDIVARASKPVGAYDIIDAMPDGTKPPTVYRALEFWEQEGFIHRISSLNLYAACRAGHRHSGGQFLICNDCGDIAEIHICDIPDSCSGAARASGFHIQGWFLELRGQCKACHKGMGPEAHTACAH